MYLLKKKKKKKTEKKNIKKRIKRFPEKHSSLKSIAQLKKRLKIFRFCGALRRWRFWEPRRATIYQFPYQAIDSRDWRNIIQEEKKRQGE